MRTRAGIPPKAAAGRGSDESYDGAVIEIIEGTLGGGRRKHHKMRAPTSARLGGEGVGTVRVGRKTTDGFAPHFGAHPQRARGGFTLRDLESRNGGRFIQGWPHPRGDDLRAHGDRCGWAGKVAAWSFAPRKRPLVSAPASPMFRRRERLRRRDRRIGWASATSSPCSPRQPKDERDDHAFGRRGGRRDGQVRCARQAVHSHSGERPGRARSSSSTCRVSARRRNLVEKQTLRPRRRGLSSITGAFSQSPSGRRSSGAGGPRERLFLDELGELPPSNAGQPCPCRRWRQIQADRGSNSGSPSTVASSAATKVDLEEAVRKGRFPGRFYYPLSVPRGVGTSTPLPRSARGHQAPRDRFYQAPHAHQTRDVPLTCGELLRALHNWPGKRGAELRQKTPFEALGRPSRSAPPDERYRARPAGRRRIHRWSNPSKAIPRCKRPARSRPSIRGVPAPTSSRARDGRGREGGGRSPGVPRNEASHRI